MHLEPRKQCGDALSGVQHVPHDEMRKAKSREYSMTTAPVSFGGVSSGLNTTAIITAEMSVYKQPLVSLQSQQTALTTQISDYQALNSQLLTLQQSADALAVAAAYAQAYAASSSNSSVATGTISSGSVAGSITLAVDQLATGSTQISAGTVASTVDVVAAGNLLVGSGGTALGLSSVSSSAGLSVGAHTIDVTQASAGATVAAVPPLAPTIQITSSNNTIAATVDGQNVTVTIPPWSYSPSTLAAAITQAAAGLINASLNSSGQLSLATTQQGSSASLQITGGTALGALGLVAGSTVYGTDGQISVDGTTTTVSNISGTGTTSVTLASGSGGTITAQIAGELSVGSMTAQNISVGDGSLSSVVAAINGANAGVTATALQVGKNQYALDVASQGTGISAASTIDTQAFSNSSLGALQTTTAAQNAIVSVGGIGGFQVTSATNAVTGLVPGLTVNLGQASASPVTITVAPDGSQVLRPVAALVDAANQVLATISSDTAYDQSTHTAGPLNGQVSLVTLAQQVLSAVGNAVGSSSAGSDGTAGESAGLAITTSGTITFNPSAFVTAYDANPTAVQAMFTEGGTFAPSTPVYAGQVSVAGATNNTVPGQYNVAISQSGAQATDTGSATFAAPSSVLASAESYTLTSDSSTTTYAATAGESLANVVSGINGALAAAGIGVSASLIGPAGSYQVKLNSAAYGAAATFGVSASGSDQLGLTTSGAAFSGTDVAGTINGQVATGSGQILSLANASDPADGLVLQITAPGITSSTSLGTISYTPGFAQGLANLAEQAIAAPGGQIPNTINGLHNTLTNVTSQIALQQQLVNTHQAMLTQEFAHMEKILMQLSAQSKFLANSLGGSSGSNSGSTPAFTPLSSSTLSTSSGG